MAATILIIVLLFAASAVTKYIIDHDHENGNVYQDIVQK
jgi:hypothetical protein